MSTITTGKIPAVIATTSAASLVFAAMLSAPTTSASNPIANIDAPDAIVRYVDNGFSFSTSTNTMMAYVPTSKLVGSAKYAAYEMFGEMRGSTQEKKNLYENMLSRMSAPIDVDIFSL